MRASRACWISLLLLAGCPEDSGTVFVDLRTDLVPGIEFTDVSVELESQTSGGPATRGADFVSGQRVARLDGLPFGTLEGVLRLRGPDGEVMSRRFGVSLVTSPRVVTVVLSRDCRGVMCPGAGSATDTACLAGTCTDPRCTVETPEFCSEDPECTVDGDCPRAADCATPVCELGACLLAPDDSSCGGTEFCDPDEGCRALPSERDAGVDMSTPDVSTPDMAAPDMTVPDMASPDMTMPDMGSPDAPARDPLPFVDCAETESFNRLHIGVVVARADGVTVTGRLEGADVTGFDEVRFEDDDHVFEVDADGTYRWSSTRALFRRDVEVPVTLTGGASAGACVTAHALGDFVRRFVGGDWGDPSSFLPEGLPTAFDETVLVMPGAGSVRPPPSADLILFGLSGATVRYASGGSPTSLIVGGRLEGDVTITRRTDIGGLFDGTMTIAPEGTPTGRAPWTLTGVLQAAGRQVGSRHRMRVARLQAFGMNFGSNTVFDAETVQASDITNTDEGGAFVIRGAGGTLTFRGAPGGNYAVRVVSTEAVRLDLNLAVTLVANRAATPLTLGRNLAVSVRMRIDRPLVLAGVRLTVERLEIGPGFTVDMPANLTATECVEVDGAPAGRCASFGF